MLLAIECLGQLQQRFASGLPKAAGGGGHVADLTSHFCPRSKQGYFEVTSQDAPDCR
jgi:hypothetical protein